MGTRLRDISGRKQTEMVAIAVKFGASKPW